MNGGLAQQVGKGYLMKGVLKLHLNLSPPNYLRQTLKDMELEMEEINKILKSKMGLDDGIETYKLDGAIESTVKRATTVLIRLKQMEHHRWLLAAPKPTRVKRGALNIGGSILKAVFGVATEEDITTVEADIALFQDDLSKATGLIKDAAEDLKLHQSLIHEVREELKNLSTKVYYTEAGLSILGLIIEMNSRMTSEELYLNQLERISEKVMIFIEKARMGLTSHASSDLLPYSLLESLDGKARQELRLDPPVGLTQQNMHLYLEQSKVMPTPEVWSLLVLFPYVDKLEPYKVASLTPFAVKQNGERVKLEVSPNDLFWLSEKLDKYMEIRGEATKKCSHLWYKGEYYCPPNSIEKSVATGVSCLTYLAHYQGQVAELWQGRKLGCPFKKVESKEVEVVQVNEARYLSVAEETHALINCMGETQVIILNATLKLDPWCSITGTNFSLSAVRATEKTERLKAITRLQLGIKHWERMKLPDKLEVFDENLGPDWVDPTTIINKTKELTKELGRPTLEITVEKVVPHATGAIGVVCLAITVAIVCLRRKRSRRDVQELPLPPPPEAEIGGQRRGSMRTRFHFTRR